MNPLNKWMVHKQYRDADVDVQEIDSTLTYWENMDHLWSIAGRKPKKERYTLRIPGKRNPSRIDFWMNNHEEYFALLEAVRELIHTENFSLVRMKHQVGRLITVFKQHLVKSGRVTDEKGWSGKLGDMMKQLASDLNYSVSSLYHAVDFYEKFPDLESFLKTGFHVARRDRGLRNKGDSKTIKISGKDISWADVLSILYPNTKRPLKVDDHICGFDTYGKYGDECAGNVKAWRLTFYLCTKHRKEWERRVAQRLAPLEYNAGMISDFEFDDIRFGDEPKAVSG